MPGVDGYWLIRQVKMLESQQGIKLPAIALTALASEEERLQALNAGFQMHVTKPVDLNQLLNEISAIVLHNSNPVQMIA